MTQREYQMHNGRRGTALAIRVTTGVKKNEVAEILSDGSIHIRLTVSPPDGIVNEALIKFLGDILKVPASKIEIVAGSTYRDKLVSILDLDAEIAQRRLETYI